MQAPEVKEETPFRVKDVERVKATKKIHPNVLTKTFKEGPLSLLQRAVDGRERVKVWVRSSYYIRAICTGFIVAYDKHFNLAMEDVNEVYINPLVMRRISKNNFKKMKRANKNNNNNNNKHNNTDVVFLPCDRKVRDARMKRSPVEAITTTTKAAPVEATTAEATTITAASTTTTTTFTNMPTTSNDTTSTTITTDTSTNSDTTTNTISDDTSTNTRYTDMHTGTPNTTNTTATTSDNHNRNINKHPNPNPNPNPNHQHDDLYAERYLAKVLLRGDSVVMLALLPP